ncbi:MAG: 30S ribosomal protein S8 [Fimbriimonas ginsengisoli]|uniref:Small ribosomal subunit protein uS8 n=1 Tax=Fimbriimonas ginsengisoli TaxID=1005039 RepID=A0A931LUD8_FIMGI|nr:30S ribosomal protein S8 [Fimbriimonas ginsengisoli]
MHSDPIADLLTRIRNGAQAHLDSVVIPHSKIKVEIVKILEAEGYLTGHEVSTEAKFPTIKAHIRYDAKRKPLINKIRRVSKPGLRVYKPCGELRPLRSGLATRILSTSQGLMTDREARRRQIGGEVICEVF